MVKVALIGVVIVLLGIVLKEVHTTYAMLAVFVGSILVIGLIIPKLQVIWQFTESLRNYLGGEGEFLKILLKMIGIAWVAEMGSNLCTDAGFSAVAKQIEMYGKILLVLVSVPIIQKLFSIITEVSL